MGSSNSCVDPCLLLYPIASITSIFCHRIIHHPQRDNLHVHGFVTELALARKDVVQVAIRLRIQVLERVHILIHGFFLSLFASVFYSLPIGNHRNDNHALP
jgi:hypothetical protein